MKRTPPRAGAALEGSNEKRQSAPESARKSTARPRAAALQLRRARAEVHAPKRKAAKAAKAA
jgi:hypothetical protein